MSQAEAIYEHYLNEVFSKIEATRLLQEFQSIATPKILKTKETLQKFYDAVLAEKLIIEEHKQALQAASNEIEMLREIIYALTASTKNRNPFEALQPTKIGVDINDYPRNKTHEAIFSYFLNFILPTLSGDQFFLTLQHDFLGTRSLFDSVIYFLLMLLDDEELDSKELLNLTESGLDYIPYFLARIDAAADFERQHFGD